MGLENFDIYFCLLFHCYCQSFISGRETGHHPMPPTKFDIFLIFPKVTCLNWTIETL